MGIEDIFKIMKIYIVQTSWKATNFTETNALWNTVHMSELSSPQSFWVQWRPCLCSPYSGHYNQCVNQISEQSIQSLLSLYINHLYSRWWMADSGRWTGNHGLLWYKTIIYPNLSDTRDIMMAYKCWAVGKIFMFLYLHHNHTLTSTDTWWRHQMETFSA